MEMDNSIRTRPISNTYKNSKKKIIGRPMSQISRAINLKNIKKKIKFKFKFGPFKGPFINCSYVGWR